MERKINKRIEGFLGNFKDEIKNKAITLELITEPNFTTLLQYIYDYEPLIITKCDLSKRKRVKNSVYYADRCCAKRANGDQCTRRKKANSDSDYCGTHLKGTPHGICQINDVSSTVVQKVEVWAQDIQGIVYYIDKNYNVYQAEDVIKGINNPKVIAKYVKNDDVYSIPEYNM